FSKHSGSSDSRPNVSVRFGFHDRLGSNAFTRRGARPGSSIRQGGRPSRAKGPPPADAGYLVWPLHRTAGEAAKAVAIAYSRVTSHRSVGRSAIVDSIGGMVGAAPYMGTVC